MCASSRSSPSPDGSCSSPPVCRIDFPHGHFDLPLVGLPQEHAEDREDPLHVPAYTLLFVGCPTSPGGGCIPLPAGSVPQHVPCSIEALLAQHFHEAWNASPFYLFQRLEGRDRGVHFWDFLYTTWPSTRLQTLLPFDGSTGRTKVSGEVRQVFGTESYAELAPPSRGGLSMRRPVRFSSSPLPQDDYRAYT